MPKRDEAALELSAPGNIKETRLCNSYTSIEVQSLVILFIPNTWDSQGMKSLEQGSRGAEGERPPVAAIREPRAQCARERRKPLRSVATIAH